MDFGGYYLKLHASICWLPLCFNGLADAQIGILVAFTHRHSGIEIFGTSGLLGILQHALSSINGLLVKICAEFAIGPAPEEPLWRYRDLQNKTSLPGRYWLLASHNLSIIACQLLLWLDACCASGQLHIIEELQ